MQLDPTRSAWSDVGVTWGVLARDQNRGEENQKSDHQLRKEFTCKDGLRDQQGKFGESMTDS